MSRNSKSAADLFAELGIDPADFTESMKLAIKQKWSNLRVTEKVDVLRKELAAIEPAEATPVEVLQAQGQSEVDAKAEHARLKRNAAVNAWRTRGQLQAALDARDLKFAALRAKRGKTAKPKPGSETGDGAVLLGEAV